MGIGEEKVYSRGDQPKRCPKCGNVMSSRPDHGSATVVRPSNISRPPVVWTCQKCGHTEETDPGADQA